MLSSHRTWLPLLRLGLSFVALCLIFSQLDVALRPVYNQTVGLPNQRLRYDPLPPASTLPFLGTSIDPAQLPSNEQTPEALKQLFERIAKSGMGWVRVRV